MTWGGPGRRAAPRRDRRLRPGARAVAGGTGAAVALAVALSGCAQHDGQALVRQACTHVDRSLSLYRSSLTTADPAEAASERAKAQSELRDALPGAATAAGEDSQYLALMTTLAESDHLPESLLVHALSAQCSAAAAGDQPVPGVAGTAAGAAGSTPPPTS